MIDYSKRETTMNSPLPIVDFSNTEIAFAHKSNKELKKTTWLFSLMNKKWLVDILSTVGLDRFEVAFAFRSIYH